MNPRTTCGSADEISSANSQIIRGFVEPEGLWAEGSGAARARDASEDAGEGSAADEALGQVALHLRDRHPLLRHGVALADRDGIVGQRVKVKLVGRDEPSPKGPHVTKKQRLQGLLDKL